tara:strand:+ start:5334 stop:5954 length:621 start_codon:yes stop_codon:yes gene_type:complete
MNRILNPITGNLIVNNSSNRKSVSKQIRNFRYKGNVYDPDRSLVLIACSKTKSFDSKKSSQKKKAIDAYSSPLFKKSVMWAKNRNKEIQIMSAKHMLIPTAKEIQNYDLSLNDLNAKQRKQWASKVSKEISEGWQHGIYDGQWMGMQVGNPIKKVYLLGGKNYTKDLKPLLENQGIKVMEPLEGMEIGERLSYLNKDQKAFEVALQ